MIKSETYKLLQEWFSDPLESLEVEVKGWLDLGDREHVGTMAKGIIALENHGGGVMIIGYTTDGQKRLVPDDTNRPEDLSTFNTDNINNLLSRFAEPKFHVDVTIQINPKTGEEFPVICVHGKTNVPVRTASETAKSIKLNRYYIRRPGPSSDEPRDAIEWEKLIGKSVAQLQTEKVIAADEYSSLDQFSQEARVRWKDINTKLDDNAKNEYGYYAFGCQILGTSKGLSAASIRQEMHKLVKYTGWPLFVSPGSKDEGPYPIAGCLEVSIKRGDSSHANFWRIRPDGFLYFQRGYHEDCDNEKVPGTEFDLTVPPWRIGEFLLIANQLGGIMFQEGFSLLVTCEWNGIENRTLISNTRHLYGRQQCREEVIRTKGKFKSSYIEGRDSFPAAVKFLLEPLYESFNFLVLPDEFYSSETNAMRSRGG